MDNDSAIKKLSITEPQPDKAVGFTELETHVSCSLFVTAHP